MALVLIRPGDKVFMASIGPATFGKDNWGKVNLFDQTLSGESIGAGIAFEENRIFQSFALVFNEGADWADTPFFQHCARRILKGRKLWGCADVEALRHRLEVDIGALYRSMKTHGFLSQREISRMVHGDVAQCEDRAAGRDLVTQFARAGYPSSISHRHEIKMGINETGRFLFLDGRHRFAIARLLGIDEIPCRVVFRHHVWADLRTRLREAAAQDPAGPEDLVPDHPDLAHLRFSPCQTEDVRALLAAHDLPALELRRPL